MSEPIWLTMKEILAIHNEILADSGGSSGILNQGALESTLAKPRNLFAYGEQDISIYKLAAAYGYGFVKNHCFVDGNKRIALLSIYTFLGRNGIELEATEEDAAEFFLTLAASQDLPAEDLKRLTDWLQNNCQSLR